MTNETIGIAPGSGLIKLNTRMTSDGCTIDLGVGSAVGAILMSEPDVSVHFWDIAESTRFPWHQHSEMEVLIVVSGAVDVSLDRRGRGLTDLPGAVFKLEDKGVLTIPADTAHDAVFLSDTALISVHIPRSSDYAKMEQG